MDRLIEMVSDSKVEMDLIEAFENALNKADLNDNIIIFGSFLTVSAIMETFNND